MGGVTPKYDSNQLPFKDCRQRLPSRRGVTHARASHPSTLDIMSSGFPRISRVIFPTTPLRFIFALAYAEVRYILEANLMKRFVSSEGFKVAARLAMTSPAIDYPTPGEDTGGRFHEHLPCIHEDLSRTARTSRGDRSPSSGSLESEEKQPVV